MDSLQRSLGTWRVIVCFLAFLPYVRALGYPFIGDDYVQIRLGRLLGSPANWEQLAAEPLYRCRATSLYLTAATEEVFGLWPVAYAASSVLLHAGNALLVLALARRLGFSNPVAVAAAGFFAGYEGHQEAVIWYAACPELLVLAFSLGSLICWTRWCERRREWIWYASSLGLFLGALLSKESGVAVVPLLVLSAAWRRGGGWTRPPAALLAAAAPFAIISAVYAAMIFLAADRHLHLRDGLTFVLSPRFLLVLPHSVGRMLIFWGALAAMVVGLGPTLWFSFGWMAAALLPYSFLTYMNRVPSRHTYFASVGLALLVGAAFVAAWERWRMRRAWAAPALAAVIVFHNCIYLWTRKHYQYLERAAPTEQLLTRLRSPRYKQRTVVLVDFPYDQFVVESAVDLATERDPGSVLVADRPTRRHTGAVLRWDSVRKELTSN